MPGNITVLGDRHGGSATQLITENGESFIRKFRDAETEKAFLAFTVFLRDEGFLYLPRCPEILREADGYHDEKIVENLPCDDFSGVGEYYNRAGALLFFAYIFGSVDLHAENIIVSGATPYIIDLETLMTGTPARCEAEYSLADSVMKSHLLPNFMNIDSKTVDCGGLCGEYGENAKNLLRLNGERVPVWKYGDLLCGGFSKTYRLALEKKDRISEKLSLFTNCRFRQLLRPTETYRLVIQYLDSLPDRLKKDKAYELLSRAYKNDIDPQRLEKAGLILDYEISEVCSGSVPLFYSYGGSLDLHSPDGCVFSRYLGLSPIGLAQKRLSGISETDLSEQLKIIGQSLDCVAPLCESTPKRCASVCGELDENALMSLPSHWTCLSTDRRGEVFFQSCGFGLYDGLAGILCCYAAYYRKTGDKSFIEKIDRYLEAYLNRVVLSDTKYPCTQQVCSLDEGIGGQIAALMHISELTGERRYGEYAVILLDKLYAVTDAVPDCDFLTGAGGLAAALAKINNSSAAALAKILLPAFSEYNPPLTGAAHGAAGVALAIGALQYVLCENKYDEKIISLIEWENGYYIQDRNNWRDLRTGIENAFMSGWCSGAPGIGMARARLIEYTDNERIISLCKRDIGRCEDFLLSQSESKRDTLCCGAAARLMAASHLGIRIAQLYERLDRACESRSPGLFHQLDTANRNMGLMQGLAGVGYALALYGDSLSGGMLI